MKQVAIYGRVSTDKQELENQLHDLRRFTKRNNWKIYKVYTDVVTGKSVNEKSRPGFDELFQDARKKLFDIILFWNLDRFSRAGALFTLLRLNELNKREIEWYSYTEQYLNTVDEPMKSGIIAMIASLSAVEAIKISQRTKAGMRGKKNVGKRGKDKKKRKLRRGVIIRENNTY